MKAGRRKRAPARERALPPPPGSGGAARGGGSAVIEAPLKPYFPLLYAAAAELSSCCWMLEMLDGFWRNFWKIPHSPWPVVAPNEAGWLSDMSNATWVAPASGASVAFVIGSG